MRVERKIVPILLVAAAWLLLSGFSIPGAFDRLRSAGYRLLGKGDIGAAERAYAQAVKERPDDPTANLDYGAALYRAQKYQEAAEAFAKAAKATDPTVQQSAEYNEGNAYYRAQQMDQAGEHYKRSLCIQPGDQDAKYNLELSQRQQQQKQQNKEQQKPPQAKPQQQKAQPKPDRMSKEEADRILKASSSDDERLQKELRRAMTTDEPTQDKDW